MARGLLGTKVGMTQIFDQIGNLIPVTVIEIAPNSILQVKTEAGKDGYNAIKVAYGDVKPQRVNRPETGVFKNVSQDPKKTVREFRVAADFVSDYSVGEEIGVGMFAVGSKVDCTSTSKGKGFAGVIKRHHFKGAKEATHGTHEYKRHPGSIGCSAYPAHVIKGKKMPGQMGNKRVTARALTVVGVYAEKNLLLVKGAVPGAKGALVETRVSAKQPDFL